MSARKVDTIRLLEGWARELRSRWRPYGCRSAWWSKRLAVGLTATGDVIRFLRNGEKPRGSIGRTARVGWLVEERGVLRTSIGPRTDCDIAASSGPLKEREERDE